MKSYFAVYLAKSFILFPLDSLGPNPLVETLQEAQKNLTIQGFLAMVFWIHI